MSSASARSPTVTAAGLVSTTSARNCGRVTSVGLGQRPRRDRYKGSRGAEEGVGRRLDVVGNHVHTGN